MWSVSTASHKELGVSRTATAVARAAASVMVVVGPPLPPVVSPMGLSFPKPTNSKYFLLDLPSKDGAAVAIQAEEPMTKLPKNFMIVIEKKIREYFWTGLGDITRRTIEQDPSLYTKCKPRHLPRHTVIFLSFSLIYPMPRVPRLSKKHQDL